MSLSLAAEIAQCRESHARLVRTIAAMSESQLGQPSRLPGWSRAYVLAHLAANADSVVRRLEAAIEGRVVDQYPAGVEGRREEIERGSLRSLTELSAHLRESAEEVDVLFAGYPPDTWERPIRALGRGDGPASSAVFARWREVEAHHVDLDLGYEVKDWPDELVERWLPSTIDGLAERADHHELLGWLLGRGTAPTLKPWG